MKRLVYYIASAFLCSFCGPYVQQAAAQTTEAHLRSTTHEERAERRAERIMLIQEQIALENNLSRVGRTMQAIVDRREGDFYVARSQYDSPEVDQEILIPASLRQLRRGCFYEVLITDAEGYDLYGEVVGPWQKKSRR